VVFVADGAGDFLLTSAALHQAFTDCHLPLNVEPFEWSHGVGRVVRDQVDYCHARSEGRKLAWAVLAYRAACPDGEVYLVGHSAGTAVVLAAAEDLPPCTVDRIFLLAPSVSADYDLRCALRATRGSIEVFHSGRDVFALGLAIAIVGTADRCWGAAAGRVGFRPVICSPADAALYSRLRQHPWDCSVAWTGNRGGHYGSYEQEYLRAYVIPLFNRGPVATSCAPPAQ
jgi:pimeloyl-ACP methyl ester carboxylesterase